MGYRREHRIFKLNFTDPEFLGLEVRAKSCPLGVFMEMSALHEVTLPLSKADEEKVYRLFNRFAESLVDWNLEDDDGNPIPATAEGVFTQEIDFILAIILSWMDAVGGVATPLKNQSNGGSNLESSIPMELISSNLVN